MSCPSVAYTLIEKMRENSKYDRLWYPSNCTYIILALVNRMGARSWDLYFLEISTSVQWSKWLERGWQNLRNHKLKFRLNLKQVEVFDFDKWVNLHKIMGPRLEFTETRKKRKLAVYEMINFGVEHLFNPLCIKNSVYHSF